MSFSNIFPTRKRALVIITIFALILVVFDSYYSKVILTDFDLTQHIVGLHNRIFNSYTDVEIVDHHSVNLIDTPGCTLPRTKLLPKEFQMKKEFKPYCDFERRIVDIDDIGEILTISKDGIKNMKENYCSVLEIMRHPRKDKYKYGREFNITAGELFNITDKQIFVTKCGKYINFDAHFPITPTVQEKIDYWKQKQEQNLKQNESANQNQSQIRSEIPNESKNQNQNQNDTKNSYNYPPISVLFMGFDTTSRSHFHRSLQRTLPLMTEMGFIDFQGYHSVAPYTLENFLAFLVGMETTVVREQCAATWSSSWDACPIIWKHFSLNKFITMYIEDSSQSFNWGGQGGFKIPPTDFYPHPIFGAIPRFRHKYHDRNHDDCLSTFNAQNYLLDYNKRFLRKFMHSPVPFFTFTWFAYPFHGSTYSLYGFDDNFHDFFQFLNSEEAKDLRERTLIILNSDHGERSGDFVKTGYEGFIERSLSGLFIRLPENLLKQFPHMNLTENLKINSKRLTGGFDIYHTLLHLLHIQNLEIVLPGEISNLNPNDTEEYDPVLDDRSSLFLPVSDKRTCKDINVMNGNCVCNTTSEASNIDTPFFTNQMVNFAIDELNQVIQQSKYRSKCVQHGKPMLAFISASVLSKTNSSTDCVLRFRTKTAAEFEVQLRIFHDKESISKMERLSFFNRLNLYGDTSWCVDFVTDEDHRMKEICHCKGRKHRKL